MNFFEIMISHRIKTIILLSIMISAVAIKDQRVVPINVPYLSLLNQVLLDKAKSVAHRCANPHNIETEHLWQSSYIKYLISTLNDAKPFFIDVNDRFYCEVLYSYFVDEIKIRDKWLKELTTV